MVARIAEIFGHPRPPEMVTEKYWDYDDDYFPRIAGEPWHVLTGDDLGGYIQGLGSGRSQPELFNYLFPIILIRWWEGLMDQTETYWFSYSLANAWGIRTFETIDEDRRGRVLEWIADAFIQAVDAWNGEAVDWRDQSRQTSLVPVFHDLTRDLPITKLLISRLSEVSTLGRAKWWLVLGNAILASKSGPFAPWNSVGKYQKTHHGSDFGEVMRPIFTVEYLSMKLYESELHFLPGFEYARARELQSQIGQDMAQAERQVESYLKACEN